MTANENATEFKRVPNGQLTQKQLSRPGGRGGTCSSFQTLTILTSASINAFADDSTSWVFCAGGGCCTTPCPR
eukprot:1117177-Amphidinium_carterae.1